MKVITVNMMEWEIDLLEEIKDGEKGEIGEYGFFENRSEIVRAAIKEFLEVEPKREGKEKGKVITVNLPSEFIEELDEITPYYASRSEVIRRAFGDFIKKYLGNVDLNGDPETIRKFVLKNLELFSFTEIEKMLMKVRQKKIDKNFLDCLDAKKKLNQDPEFEMVSIPVQLSSEISSAASQYKSYKIVPREKNEKPVPTNSYEENVIPLI